ncbi:MAG: TRAP transporter large permease [Synergistaceae bacterium]|jgi:C4-dicarboxylate transporter DctM subunit|nr:TRAP transporter large permease [Synergistaceae bacterium]
MILVMLAILVVLVLIGMPIAFATGVSSLFYLLSNNIPLNAMPQNLVSGINSFTIFAIPFFFLAGELMNSSGITDRIIKFSMAFVGHIRGGLAQVNILASVVFAGISGSATADTAAIGSILIPAMKKEGYDADFAAAITVASSMIGPIIPPSIGLVLYGVIAQQSIGKLLAAGILPGLVIAGTQMLYTYFYSIKMNYPTSKKLAFPEFWRSIWQGLPALAMPAIIVVGILSGVFTPTESAAAAVFYGFFMGFFVYREFSGKKTWDLFSNVALRSIRILIIISFATMFSWVVTRAQVPTKVLNAMLSFSNNPDVLLFCIVLFLLFIGMFMIPSAIQIVVTPILVPVIIKLGIDPIHFGVLLVFTTGIGSITPPVGVCLSLAADIAGISYKRMAIAVLPLYIPIFAAVLIIAYVPWISTVIPSIFFK